jgi:hypothetical protein
MRSGITGSAFLTFGSPSSLPCGSLPDSRGGSHGRAQDWAETLAGFSARRVGLDGFPPCLLDAPFMAEPFILERRLPTKTAHLLLSGVRPEHFLPAEFLHGCAQVLSGHPSSQAHRQVPSSVFFCQRIFDLAFESKFVIKNLEQNFV